ncbi:MAG TPA: hypothetical protein VGJ28_27355 [Micromonosporaceae bacterium]
MAGGLVASSLPASAAPVAWHTVPANWGAQAQFIEVGQVYTSGNQSWFAVIKHTSTAALPVVQACTGAVCTLQRLPMLGYDDGYALGVSGTSSTDVWVVGSLNGEDGTDAMSWHWDGTKWTAFRGPDGFIFMTQVLTVSANESWALGNDNFGDGTTGTIFHRVGTSWTEVNSVLTPDVLPGTCAEWYYNGFSDLAYVGGEPVVVGVCDGVHVILKQRSATSWARIDTALPTDVVYTHATVVNNQLWVSGQRPDGSTDIERRASGQWIAVPATGLTGANIQQMAAGPNGTVVAVGYTGTVEAPTSASWQWDGSTWTPISTPGNARLSTVSVASNGYTVAGGFNPSNEVKPAFLSRTTL